MQSAVLRPCSPQLLGGGSYRACGGGKRLKVHFIRPGKTTCKKGKARATRKFSRGLPVRPTLCWGKTIPRDCCGLRPAWRQWHRTPPPAPQPQQLMRTMLLWMVSWHCGLPDRCATCRQIPSADIYGNIAGLSKWRVYDKVRFTFVTHSERIMKPAFQGHSSYFYRTPASPQLCSAW